MQEAVCICFGFATLGLNWMPDFVRVVLCSLAVNGWSGSARMRFSSLQHVSSIRLWMSGTLCSTASSGLYAQNSVVEFR